MKPELVHQENHLSIERLTIPGGFLYITRYWSCAEGPLAVATTFVPFEIDK